MPLFLLFFCIPFAYAHSDPMSALIQNENGILPNLKIMGLYSEEKEEIEFLSEEWAWKNFIYLVSGTIIGIMALTVTLSYRSEYDE